MPIPGENYLALADPVVLPPLEMTVLDLVAANLDTIALVTWYRAGPPPELSGAAGSALIRFDPAGTVLWQTNLQLCPGDGDCTWGWDEAALVRTPDGVIVAGTSPAPGSYIGIVAARFTDAGKVVWVKHYRASIDGTEWEGSAHGIVRVAGSLPEQYLIAGPGGATDLETWFFQIDGAGNVIDNPYRIAELGIYRLRSTPTQGIFAVGSRDKTPFDSQPYIVNLDPTTGLPRWGRLYSTPLAPPPPTQRGPFWFDIAEGVASLVVVGNTLEVANPITGFIASLELDTPDPTRAGDVRWARTPTFEGRVLGYPTGVANMQFDPIPIRSAAAGGVPQEVDLLFRYSAFAICGQQLYGGWLLLMMEDGTIAWQKGYAPVWPFDGYLIPIIWPSYSQIVAGGPFQTLDGSSPERAMIVSSSPDPGRGRLFCSAETHAQFPYVPMTSESQEVLRKDLSVRANDWSFRPLNPLPIEQGCPRAPQTQTARPSGAAAGRTPLRHRRPRRGPHPK
jgi:hypothetical protein